MTHQLVSQRAFSGFNVKALAPPAQISPSRCRSFNTSSFCCCCCCLHPDDNFGSEGPTKDKEKGGNESQGKDEDVGPEKKEEDEEKSDAGEGMCILEPEKSVNG